MRTFGNFEKDVLKFMVYHPEPQDMCAIALFEKFCNCYLIKWTEDFSKLILVYDKGACGYSKEYGHVEVSIGGGQAASDGIQNIKGKPSALFIPV